jgi:HEAT repeat protein
MKSRVARQAVLLVAAGLLTTLAGPAVPATAGESPQAAVPERANGETPTSPAAEEPAAEGEAVADALPWLSSLEEGFRRATAERKPLLVRAGAAWCPVCRELEEQLRDPKVQAELQRWTRVYVDVDQSPGDAEQLNVSVVPALRIRSSGGWTVASRDGYVSAENLVAWLGEQYKAALAEPDRVLLESGSPDAAAVVDLVRQFGDRSPAVREAAIRRLLPHPEVARAAVVDAFREGTLAARLTALELLREWRAPVEGIDPWRPDTISEERLTALEKWRGETGAEPPAQPEKLTPDELASARREIERMLKSTDTEAGAIRERLARLGASLMPEVYARLSEASTDQDRERLLALRYRLVADGGLVLRWPGGIARLAATDSRQRQQAAEELAQLATGSDQPLLLEMFSDPDPLVREISLRGLQHIGGKEATAALVKLLADPEPNVRAAVLKQLEEDPRESMVPKVVEYLKTEKDPDLIVHAIRFLRATGGEQSLKCLMTLLDHESWQVRAEAAAGVGKTDAPFRGSFSGYDPFGGGDESTALRADACAALLERLDDPDAFVVSRAVEGLARVDMAVAVEPLAKAAEQHPALAASIVEILADGENMRPKALPYLRRFCEHADPGIRAAAIGGLARAAPRSAEKALAAGLKDPESTVRTAAASALFELFETHRSAVASAMEQEASSRGPRTIPRVYGGPADPFGTEEGGSLISRVMRMLRHAPSPEAAGEPEPPAEDESAEPQDVTPLEPLPEMEGAQGKEAASKANEGEAAPRHDETDTAPAGRWEEWRKCSRPIARRSASPRPRRSCRWARPMPPCPCCWPRSGSMRSFTTLRWACCLGFSGRTG